MNFEEAQKWMHAAIVAEEAPGEADEVLKSTNGVCAHRRLGVYRDMYRVRMSESLQMDYGLLQSVVGEEEFESLCWRYLKDFPSTSYTLNDLGRNFADFLEIQADLPPYVGEIARLEYAIVRSFDAFDPTPADWVELSALPLETLCQKSLRPLPSFVGERFNYNLNSLYDAYVDETLSPGIVPQEQVCNLLFFRENFQVRRLSVEDLSWKLYQGLRESRDFGEALDPVLALAKTPDEQQKLLASFQEWVGRSLLYSA
ncbi:MAG: putative DNA-binding domain-containing protein [Bdellovibrionaceae bacterium]|nr:putative DNA-binding domain-containing protein [Bdellovibrionales bacterium]MCB9253825.1 putative DNA-binding domain-containing protein [Pseudobdellovibrionaceae bacterium]